MNDRHARCFIKSIEAENVIKRSATIKKRTRTNQKLHRNQFFRFYRLLKNRLNQLNRFQVV